METDHKRPVIALTMGDVAGVGPEVVARAVTTDAVTNACRPIVVGNPVILQRACDMIDAQVCIRSIDDIATFPRGLEAPGEILCWNPSNADTASVAPGQLDPRAGQAAYDWLIAATDAALIGQIDGIVTAPLNKAALHRAGQHYPGHTEILAERCGVSDFAMMLYLPQGDIIRSPFGLGVAHVTLHTSIASVPTLLSTEAIFEKIQLVHNFLQRIGCQQPRVGVCALNPHAGEQGLFGNEEAELIMPAVERSNAHNMHAIGPLPADTLLQRAVGGSFDGVVAMYHDQGHIALKLIGFQKAVNVTLGLPIVRTSPSHGTAFDIAWQQPAGADGMIEAIRVAIELVKRL